MKDFSPGQNRVELTGAFSLEQVVIPPLHRIISTVITALHARMILAVLGFLWIKAETVSLKRSTWVTPPPRVRTFAPVHPELTVTLCLQQTAVHPVRSQERRPHHRQLFQLHRPPLPRLPASPPAQPALPRDPSHGRRPFGAGSPDERADRVAHLCSYNPTFTLPVSKPLSGGGQVTGYRRVSLLAAVLATGRLPERAEGGESLDEVLGRASGPVVVFPEVSGCTDSACPGEARCKALRRVLGTSR